MHTHLSRSALVLLVLGATGCKEYFSVEEACHPEGKFQGMDNLGPSEQQAVDYMNCHRRLVQFSRFAVAPELAQEAKDVGNYVLANPSEYGVLGNAASFLIQKGANQGFTGTELYERLDAVDYEIIEAARMRGEEIIGIIPNEEITGRDAVEFLMKFHWGQETVLTPSTYDMGYREVILSADWWQASGYTNPDGTVPTTGTFMYAVVMSELPPLEGAGDLPVMYPKRDQVAVPLTGFATVDRFQPDLDTNGTIDADEITYLSYPLTVGYTSPLTATASVASAFDLKLTGATIQGPNGPLNTVWADPGDTDPLNNRLASVDGRFSYWAAGVYATEPFEPNTVYTLYVDLTTVDGPVSHNVTFTTAAQDPLSDPVDATRSRSARPDGAPRFMQPPPLAVGRRSARFGE